MRSRDRKFPYTIALIVALVSLLGLLAFMQFHWLGQVSAGERTRMHAAVAASANRFAEDFDHELARVYAKFQLEGDVSKEAFAPGLTEKLAQWRQTAPYPDLIDGIFLVQNDPGAGAILLKYSEDHAQLEPSAWPAEFQNVRMDVSRAFGMAGVLDQDALPPGAVGARNALMETMQPDIPGLVVPLMPGLDRVLTINRTQAHGEELTRVTFAAPAYLVITLNLEVIQQKLLPDLTRRYFFGADGLDFNVTVADLSEHSRVVYTTLPDAQTGGAGRASLLNAAERGDVSAAFFELREKDLDALSFRGAPDSNEPGAPSAGVYSKTVRVGSERESSSRSQALTKKHSTSSFSVRVFNKRVLNGSAEPAGGTAMSGKWLLVAQHRAGSVDGFIAATRRRNLITSFGILALLAASTGLIVVSSRRAQKLAQRQIEFVSSVSHEFRTPLAVICSAGENLADSVVTSPTQVARYGDVIRGEGRRLTEMVEQLLEFAGVSARKRKFTMQAVFLPQLLDETLEMLSSALSEKQCDPDIQIDSGLPPVLGDPAALRQCLHNLVANALKYSDAPARLVVSMKQVKLGTATAVEVAVRDHGFGIPRSELAQVFEPFFRGADVTAKQIHGNGLGLSLVQQIVKAHGGKVSATSDLGQGSRFVLCLPVASDLDVAAHSDHNQSPAALVETRHG